MVSAFATEVFRYAMDYGWALAWALVKAASLTWAFVSTGLGLTAFAVLLLVISEVRGLRAAASGEGWLTVLKDWRARLSDGFVVFLYALAIVFAFNILRAPLILWNDAVQRVSDDARHKQKGEDDQQYKKELDGQAANLKGQLKSATDQIGQLQQQMTDKQTAFNQEEKSFFAEKQHVEPMAKNNVAEGKFISVAVPSNDTNFPFEIKTVVQFANKLVSPATIIAVCDENIGRGEATVSGLIFLYGTSGNYE